MEVTKYYNIQDMARIGCNDCEGCHACCQGMGDSVVLTPYDVHVLSIRLGLTVDDLFQEWLQLTVVDGLLQPSMAMNGTAFRRAAESGETANGSGVLAATQAEEGDSGCCHALGENGRCSIHAFRPSICRLFPLGREYTEEGIRYFVLEDACPAPVKTKVKIAKWVERPEFKEHEVFLMQWHGFKKLCMARLAENMDETYHKQLLMYVLQLFYRKPYRAGFFYQEFLGRLKAAEEVLCG